MADLPTVTPDYFEILVVRELRKVGFDVGAVRIHRRAELPEPERGFVLELLALLSRPPWTRQVLIACRRQEAPIAREVVDSLKARLKDAAAEAALVFSTVEFTPDALAAGREAGVGLLRVVDGHSVFDASGWGPSGHYPAWLPAYLAQVVDRDVTGEPRVRLLEAGRADMILDCFQIEKEQRHG